MLILLRLIDLYELILILAAILSWVSPTLSHPAARLIRAITEPVLRPLRRVLPRMGEVDFSPVAAIVLLEVLSLTLVRIG
ncbi:YggT family protein [bacterium]|nr:YggT family protein [bacterium]